jgi:uncharacterized membrane protein YbhN (UPF0104 family)
MTPRNASASATAPPADPAPRAVPLPDGLELRPLLRRGLQIVAIGLLTAILISTLPGLDELRQQFAHAQTGWLVAVAVLELASCLSFVAAFRGVFCRRLGWGFSYKISLAAQATNVLVPAGGVGGLALGAWALRQGGMNSERIARRSVAFFVLTSAPNFACAGLFGLAIVTGVLHGSGPPVLTTVLAVLAFVTIATVALLPHLLRHVEPPLPDEPNSRSRASRARRNLRHGTVRTRQGVSDAAWLLRRHPAAVVPGAVGYMAFDVAALAAAFAAFGTTLPLAAFVFAYVVGQLGGLIPVPGGIGGTDGGLIGALVLFGSPVSQAAAAVLAYRAVQLGIPAVLGSIAFVQLRRALSGTDAPAALCEPVTDDLPGLWVPRLVRVTPRTGG